MMSALCPVEILCPQSSRTLAASVSTRILSPHSASSLPAAAVFSLRVVRLTFIFILLR